MDRPDDLDVKSAEILTALEHANHDGEAYWNAVHAVGSLVAELVALRGFRSASLAYLRGPIDGVIEEACVVAADAIDRGEHRRDMTTEEVRRAEAPDSVHRTVYVVRPDERGVFTYDSCGIEHAQMTTPMIDIFSVEQPFLQTTVQRCIVRPNSVCEHGWFCTDNYKVAAMVDELRGERAAVVAWLRERANAEHPIERGVPSLSPVGRGLLLFHADIIERGDHRREEER